MVKDYDNASNPFCIFHLTFNIFILHFAFIVLHSLFNIEKLPPKRSATHSNRENRSGAEAEDFFLHRLI